MDPALVSETERYDFRWYGKTRSKRDAFTPSRATLVYDPARSVNPDKAGGGNRKFIQKDFTKNEVFLAKDAHKESLICLDPKLESKTVDHFKAHKDQFFICLEFALNTTKKWNLKHNLGEKLKTI